MNNTFHYTSPLGGITLASDSETLTGLWFDGQKYFLHKLVEESSEAELPIFTQTCNWLDIYFSEELQERIKFIYSGGYNNPDNRNRL